MSKIYTVGRGSAADIKVQKHHDAVGKLHLSLEDAGPGLVRVADLKSTNGTFVHVSGKWLEIKEPRVVPLDAELKLGDFETTPRRLLSEATTAPLTKGASKKNAPAKPAPPPPTVPPAKKRTGPRRNEFGEIVHE